MSFQFDSMSPDNVKSPGNASGTVQEMLQSISTINVKVTNHMQQPVVIP